MNPNSYSWCLMRYAIVKYVLINITSFLGVVGIEPNGKYLKEDKKNREIFLLIFFLI